MNQQKSQTDCIYFKFQKCCLILLAPLSASVCVVEFGVAWKSGGGSAETPKLTPSTKLGLRLRFLPSAVCDTEPV